MTQVQLDQICSTDVVSINRFVVTAWIVSLFIKQLLICVESEKNLVMMRF